jgi:hypothetical protein
LAVVLTAQAAPAVAQSVNVAGKMSNGAYVQAVCSVGSNGKLTGTGSLFGTNPANGFAYKYPFIISNGSTGPGTLTLTGTIAGTSYPVTLTATVPNGPMTFTYVIGSNSYTLTGIGKVTVK